MTLGTFWHMMLHDGVMAGTASPTAHVEGLWGGGGRAEQEGADGVSAAWGRGLEPVLWLDATVWDGRFAKNGGLRNSPNR